MKTVWTWSIIAVIVLQFGLLLAKTTGLASYPPVVAWLPCIVALFAVAGIILMYCAPTIRLVGLALLTAQGGLILAKATGLISWTWNMALIPLYALIIVAFALVVIFFVAFDPR